MNPMEMEDVMAQLQESDLALVVTMRDGDLWFCTRPFADNLQLQDFLKKIIYLLDTPTERIH